MRGDESNDERAHTRVLALSYPASILRAVVDGLRACEVDVSEVHFDQAAPVLDQMRATRANVLLAYADERVRLGLELASKVPVVCVVPADDGGAWRVARESEARAVVRLMSMDPFEPDWIALLRALHDPRPRGAMGTVRGRVLVVERPTSLMDPVARALKEGRLEVLTNLGLTARDVVVEYARSGADVVVAYADSFGEALSDCSSMQLVLAYRATDAAARDLAFKLRPGKAIELPSEEERADPSTRGAWSNVRSTIAWAAHSSLAHGRIQAEKRRRERADASRAAGRAPSGIGPDLAALTRTIEARIRARKLGADIDPRPIHVPAMSTVTPPVPRSIDEVLADEAPRPFLHTYGVAYDGIPPEEMPAYVRRKLLESTGDAPGATEPFAMAALHAFAADEERLRATAHAILKSPVELSSALKGHLAKVLYRLGERARAEALVRGIDDPDVRVLAADIAEAHHDLPRALDLSERAAGQRLETLGVVERVARFREALFARRAPPRARGVVPLLLRGEPWTVVFDEHPVLGRADAAIVVGSPLVSRRHLAFRAGANTTEVEDLRSQHGTYVDGARLCAPLPIDRARELRLANSIVCHVRPASLAEGGVGVVVDVADRHWRLPFGSVLDLGPLRLAREGTTLTASAREGLLYVDGVAAPETASSTTLFPGAKVRVAGVEEVDVEIDADAFDP